MSGGMVYLIGAGPGDPGLLTLRGREAIAAADVIIHDYLVDPRILRFARPHAEIVPSGKSGDAACRDRQQAEINQRMIDAARAGKVVARVKGGDPFVFGRGGEEADALVDAAVAYEVVPGVTSAIAVAAYAGIPVTERGLNASFTVVTGHEAPGTTRPIDWPALARMETIVVLMGLRELADILERLVRAGKPADTPAACIRSGTRPDQQTVVATVGDLAARVRAAGFEPPATVIIGDVVKRRERLAWYERRPLLGRRIVVTRAAEPAVEFADRLERLGAQALVAPTIELRDVEHHEPFDAALAAIGSFDWIVFTSAHGVEVFFARLLRRGGDVRELWRARLAAIGPGTATALEKRGLRVEVVPAEFRAEALAEILVPRVGGKKVLLPRAEGARDVLPKVLAVAKADVHDVATYRAVPVEGLSKEVGDLLERDAIDAITFTSSSTVRHFHAALRGRPVGRAAVATIGPITADTAREVGLRVDVVAREYTIEGLAAALVDYFATRG
jgi:uroporphyrinogen III methyltransferase / synthase